MAVSPLRYPGGKARLFQYFASIIRDNGLYRHEYCEPYAGGAGLALQLLSNGFVDRIALNDIDEAIFAFWQSAIFHTDDFCSMIERVPITVEEWFRQRDIWKAKDTSSLIELGFAAYFLNRTNRSGIIEGAGPIGGYSQEGKWGISARFEKSQQIKNLMAVASFRDRISLSRLDAQIFAQERFQRAETFCYLDPPYYVKGSKLYRNYYGHADHCAIRDLVSRHRNAKWVVSYDDVDAIRDIYQDFAPVTYSMAYSAGRKSAGREVIFFSDALVPPSVRGFVSCADNQASAHV